MIGTILHYAIPVIGFACIGLVALAALADVFRSHDDRGGRL